MPQCPPLLQKEPSEGAANPWRDGVSPAQTRFGGVRVFSIVIMACLAFTPAAVRAQEPNPPPPPSSGPLPPSPFETGMRGFGMGLTAGVAGGYLVARDNGWSSSDWRPLVAGAGIGALAGGALGLTLGLVDSNNAASGRGPTGRSFLIMRGMSDGGTFGLVTGGIIGGLAALKTDKPEHILFGAAIGALAGTAVGLLYGSLQPNPWSPRRDRVAWHIGISPYATARGDLVMGPAAFGRF